MNPEFAARPPVLIVGAHRSGTSATARALKLLGLQIGQKLDSHDEPRELQTIHETYLRRVGAAWYNPGPFLASLTIPEGKRAGVEYLRGQITADLSVFSYRKGLTGWWLRRQLRNGRPWGWKEPRTTLFGECWLEIFPNARILHVIRNPLAVATSIQRRELEFQSRGDEPSGQVQDFNYCVEVAMTYVEAGEDLASHASHFCRVRFEDLQTDTVGQLTKLAEFCGLAVSEGNISRAAATIRPTRADRLRQANEKREILARYPLAAKLGYGVD
jgi:hypothetical protein